MGRNWSDNDCKRSPASNVCSHTQAIIRTAKPQESDPPSDVTLFNCVRVCVCVIQNNVYILYVKYGQVETGLFVKYSIII